MIKFPPIEPNSLWLSAARRIAALPLMALLIGLAGAVLLRNSPGFGVGEQDMDIRLSRESRAALRAGRDSSLSAYRYYSRYLAGLSKGDLGMSRTYGQPVAALLRERWPVTRESLWFGIAVGIGSGAAFALLGRHRRFALLAPIGAALGGAALAMPVSIIACLLLWAGAPPKLAMALAVFPYVYRYSANLLAESYAFPHIVTAHAKGLSPARILIVHVLVPLAPELVSLAAMAVTISLSAMIPVEVVSDSPGIGQLAFQAALNRDLPLMSGVTTVIAMATLAITGFADFLIAVRPAK